MRLDPLSCFHAGRPRARREFTPMSVVTTPGMTMTTRTCGALQRSSSMSASEEPLMANSDVL